MAVLFVSDVHLSARRPQRVEAFLWFLEHMAPRAQALYLLGDLFDQWLGDDDTEDPHKPVVRALAKLAGTATAVYAMHGNHDFLLGAGFAEQTGARLLPDPSLVDVYGTPVLLMHGDSLCTDDVKYQQWRIYSRNPENQRMFLSLPMADRVERAAMIRDESSRQIQRKPEEIMDVNAEAVARTLREYGVRHLIHGHTHRPAVHTLDLDGGPATRIVLGDWYQGDSVLLWTEGGYRLSGLAELGQVLGESDAPAQRIPPATA